MKEHIANGVKTAQSSLDNIIYITKYGTAIPAFAAFSADVLKPLLGRAALVLFIISAAISLSITLVHFGFRLKKGKDGVEELKASLPETISAHWLQGLLIACLTASLVFGITSFAGEGKKNGYLAETFVIVKNLQETLGIVSENVKTIKSNTEKLLEKSDNLDENIAKLIAATKAIQEKATDNPRKQLAEHNIPFSMEAYEACLRTGDIDSLNLFYKAGFNPADTPKAGEAPYLFDVVQNKRKNYEKIVLLAVEYGFDINEKRYNALNAYFAHTYDLHHLLQEFGKDGKISFAEMMGYLYPKLDKDFIKLLVTLGADEARMKHISYLANGGAKADQEAKDKVFLEFLEEFSRTCALPFVNFNAPSPEEKAQIAKCNEMKKLAREKFPDKAHFFKQ